MNRTNTQKWCGDALLAKVEKRLQERGMTIGSDFCVELKRESVGGFGDFKKGAKG